MSARFLPQPRNLASVMGLQKTATRPVHVTTDDHTQRRRRVVSYSDYDSSTSTTPHKRLHAQGSSVNASNGAQGPTLLYRQFPQLSSPVQSLLRCDALSSPTSASLNFSLDQMATLMISRSSPLLAGGQHQPVPSPGEQPQSRVATIAPVSVVTTYTGPAVPEVEGTDQPQVLTAAPKGKIPSKTRGLRAASGPAKKKKRIQKSRKEPARCDFDSEADYHIAWERWRKERDNNNASVHKSRALFRQQRSERAQLIHRKENEKQQLISEAETLKRALQALVKAVREPASLSAQEKAELRDMMKDYEPGSGGGVRDLDRALMLAHSDLASL